MIEIGDGRSRLVVAAILAVVSTVVNSPAFAKTRPAPLPEGLAASDAVKVRGLYAEKILGGIYVNESLATLEEDCKSRGLEARIVGRDKLVKGMSRIYRTRQNVAVIEDRPTLKSDAATCTAQIFLRRDHSVRPASSKGLQDAGWIEKRPNCGSRLRRCMQQTIASVRSQCVDLGDGLVGSWLCYSTEKGLSEGLIVGGANYTDDGSGPDNSWALGRVDENALIDPVVFATPEPE